jgi:hypothetical protein
VRAGRPATGRRTLLVAVRPVTGRKGGSPVTSADPAHLQYLEQMFAYEEEGFRAAEHGDYEKAIEIWSRILADKDRRDCFNKEAQQEMAFNLAAAYYLTSDNTKFEQVAIEWSLSEEDKAKIRDGVETTG